MALSAIGQIPFLAVAATAGSASGSPSIPVVILTGLSLVFGILIILYLILLAQGKVFSSIDARKKAPKAEEKPQKAAPAPAPVAAPLPVVQEGIPPEVVAAIAAAVAQVEEGKYTLQSIQAAPAAHSQTPADRRGRWGFAGVISSTEPF